MTDKQAALDHSKKAAAYLLTSLAETSRLLTEATQADDLNVLIGTLMSESDQLRDIASDIDSMIRVARRAQKGR
jgi:hypothetical protein